MHVSQLHGHSLLTWLVRFGGAEFVLRRASVAPAAPQVHDVPREYHWLSAIHPVFPLAPKPFLLCEDESVIGSAFLLMERRRGFAVRDEEPVTLIGHRELRRQLSDALVDAMVSLHDLDVEGLLDIFDAPAGYVDRQVREWTERWNRVRLGPVVDMDAVALWLFAHQPAESLEPAVVHGNFTLDNLLLNPLNPAEITAVLDWESTALGDPLCDLGVLLAHWDPTPTSDGQHVFPRVTGGEGYPTRDALMQTYVDRSGRDLSEIAFYEVLALFQSAVRCQQSPQDESADGGAERVTEQVRALARRARALIQ